VRSGWGLLLLRLISLAKEYPDGKFRVFLGILFNKIKTSHL